jgi:hypothetical protein
VSLALDVFEVFFILYENHIPAWLCNRKIAGRQKTRLQVYQLLLFWRNDGEMLLRNTSAALVQEPPELKFQPLKRPTFAG